MLALDSWNLAKKHLEEAIALAETREREFREISEDVKRRLGALDLVASMARELEAGPTAERSLPAKTHQAMLAPPDESVAKPDAAEPSESALVKATVPPARPLDPPVRRSWRPLFARALPGRSIRQQPASLSLRS